MVIELKGIVKKYFIGKPNELSVLKGMTLGIEAGSFVSIVGQSGSGKSTLMNILGALDRPTEGEYLLDGVAVAQLQDDELSQIRNQKIGFVFQTFNLIPRISALANVELPLFYKGAGRRERRERAMELLRLVGMEDRMEHQPNELSGGQKQRVAIARSLANNPSIVLADEPTGALDTETGNMVMDIFRRIHREERRTIVLITHNEELAKQTDRIITIRDGQIVGDQSTGNKAATPVPPTASPVSPTAAPASCLLSPPSSPASCLLPPPSYQGVRL
ncbi:MAG: ABC transporter ATP-binding protein [Oscillospiraceae bacterium]|jgi:putative ABC transport system ATP-binding protein|nr:ABC transporter ATP-binding protein [Oscillospiraceae bacterium]